MNLFFSDISINAKYNHMMITKCCIIMITKLSIDMKQTVLEREFYKLSLYAKMLVLTSVQFHLLASKMPVIIMQSTYNSTFASQNIKYAILHTFNFIRNWQVYFQSQSCELRLFVILESWVEW